MSRTFRRRNYETVSNRSSDTGGAKIAGYYTEYDWYYTGYDYPSKRLYRLPTKEELYEKFREAHCDGVFNRWGIDKWWRSSEEHTHRQREKLKVIGYLKGNSCDVILDKLHKRQPWTWRC